MLMRASNYFFPSFPICAVLFASIIRTSCILRNVRTIFFFFAYVNVVIASRIFAKSRKKDGLILTAREHCSYVIFINIE